MKFARFEGFHREAMQEPVNNGEYQKIFEKWGIEAAASTSPDQVLYPNRPLADPVLPGGEDPSRAR